MLDIRRVRLEKGLTIPDVCKKSGILPGYLSELETGKKDNPSLKMLEQIAGALDCTVGELLTEDEDGEEGGRWERRLAR